jgi:hypothetical protein
MQEPVLSLQPSRTISGTVWTKTEGALGLSPALRSCVEYSAFDRLKNSRASSATLRVIDLAGGR